jgi:SAM-dependent methyltransferase
MSTSSAVEDVPHIFEPGYYERLYRIEEQHWWAAGMRDAMAALLDGDLKRHAPLRVLDAGCGTGYLFEYLRRYPLDGAPVGIDLSMHGLRFCRERGASALACASVVQLPFAAETFDLIICIDTIQHLSPAGADATTIREFARLLRPGGLLYLRTNSARGHAPLSGVDPDLYRRYDLPAVIAMLAGAGLQIERATYLNALPALWPALREYLRRGPQQAAPIGPGLTIRSYSRRLAWLNALLRQVSGIEAWVIGALGQNLPFGHSTAFVARKPSRRASE